MLVAEAALQAGHADLIARHKAFKVAVQASLQSAVVDAALRARDAIVQHARADVRRAVRRGRGQAVVAQFIAAQGQAAGMHGLAVACILVEEGGAATDADVVARHHIAQHKIGAVVTQGAVIDLAIAADAHRQRARRDGESRRAAQADVVLGRPQACRCIAAHIARVAAVAEAAIYARVAVDQSHIADRTEEGSQLAIVDLARSIARKVHLQRFQESLQHRRRVAIVDAPHAAEIVVVEHALLLHLRRAASAGTTAIHQHQRCFIIKKTIAERGTGRHAAGYRAHCRIAAASHGATAEDMADAARAFADQPAHVFPGENGIGNAGPAHGTAGIRIIDAAAVQAHQAADAACASDIAGGIRLAQRALVIANQAADHFTRARHHAGGIRGRDAGAGRIQSRQAADGAAAIGIDAGDGAAAGGQRDGAPVAAHQAANIALATDGHAAVHAIDIAADDLARQRAHVGRTGDAAAAQGQVAQGAALDGAKQACRRTGRQAAVDFQVTESKSGAIEHAGKTAAAAGDRHKTLAIVPVRGAAGVDIARQAIAVAKAEAADALQAMDIGDQIGRGRTAVAACRAQEAPLRDAETARGKRGQAGAVLHPAAAIEQEVAARADGAARADVIAGSQGQALGHAEGAVQVDIAARAQHKLVQLALRRQVHRAHEIDDPGKTVAAHLHGAGADGLQFRFAQTQAAGIVRRAGAQGDGAHAGTAVQADGATRRGRYRLRPAAQAHIVGNQIDRAGGQAAATGERQQAAGRGGDTAAVLAQRQRVRDEHIAAAFEHQVFHAAVRRDRCQVDRLLHRQVAACSAADMHAAGGDAVQFGVCQAQAAARLVTQRDLPSRAERLQGHPGIAGGAANIDGAVDADVVRLQQHRLTGDATAQQLIAAARQVDGSTGDIRAQGQIAVADIHGADAKSDAGAGQPYVAIAAAERRVQIHIRAGAIGHASGRIIGRQRDMAAIGGDGRIDIDDLARLRRQAHALLRDVDGAIEIDAVQGLQRDVAAGAGNEVGADAGVAGGRRVGELIEGTQLAARTGDHGDIVRIEQPVAALAMRRAGIDADAIDGQVMAGCFHEAPVAALRTAARGNAAVYLGRFIAPGDDLAAVATMDGIGIDAGVLADEHLPRILHGRVLALVVAAQQDRAAARGAAGVDCRVAQQTHLLAQHLDVSPLAHRASGTGDAARLEQRLAAGLEHDPAILADDGAVGVEHAALADQRAGHADAAALGDDLAQVQGLVRWCRDQHAQLRIAGVGQLHAASGRQDHFAIWRRDDARVFHVRRDQQHLPALARVDGARIADGTGHAGGRELALAGQEILVRHAQTGRHQPVHVHFRALAKNDAVRVDQEDLAVRFERAQDLAGVLSRDAVEYGAIAVLLDETRDFARMDGKTLPVDDGVGRVRDREDVALLVERRLSVDHLRQGGVGLRRAKTAGQQQRQRRAAQGQRKG
ncbi:hypothetical protein JAB1_34770 [Janthinobacterium sp. MP5059B]|nr:hypothetical protein JAB1_34770 [Janthinobacterium sp. MP5059B]